ncbi:DNA-binding CsgD family transcriptional regulator [Allocatelliglobosispora scoriae]|uniref:DNA-binding CsgD family transcriptional regulator n=1 Tax=Allocatelliglobosispora scoriae TaxID=643052 RepID=A0A841BNI7_9ACTN|nr:LuxR family transcriptional regulator [Allocatelliglobosispora scoriae]MBB5868370.1 DNA-binding CsgD family transcriptional regulator [Allocatelliglobosispora scoriae]
MTDDQRFSAGAPIPSLVRWGRSPDADLVYRAIVTRGAGTAARIADDLGLGRQRVRDALGELQAINAVTLDPQRRWHPRPPAEVVADLRRSRSRPFDGQDQHQRHRDLLHRLAPDRNTMLGYGIQHLPTRQAARDRLAALVAIERHEHLAMNIEQSMDVEVAQAALPIHRALHARGIPTRTIGPPPLDGDALRPEIRELGRLRMESRDSLDVPLKLFVIDRRVALFPLVPHDHDRGFLEISQPPLVEALLAQFERHWAAAIDPEEHRMPSTALTPREQNLVALLAQGHTDASAARELRIGVRSVTKIIRGLMDRLHVENRFQLGLALGILRAAHLPPVRPAHDSTERR